jgi:hypothetical protein
MQLLHNIWEKEIPLSNVIGERDKLAEEWKMILEQLSEDLKVIRDAITAEKDEVLIRLSRKGFAKWL